ncbi:hypothetical protein HK405_003719 [Cladochytrium tenue]|nr:hypothetical protein HK405_003719 [Cladochytrium tenue]
MGDNTTPTGNDAVSRPTPVGATADGDSASVPRLFDAATRQLHSDLAEQNPAPDVVPVQLPAPPLQAIASPSDDPSPAPTTWPAVTAPNAQAAVAAESGLDVDEAASTLLPGTTPVASVGPIDDPTHTSTVAASGPPSSPSTASGAPAALAGFDGTATQNQQSVAATDHMEMDPPDEVAAAAGSVAPPPSELLSRTQPEEAAHTDQDPSSTVAALSPPSPAVLAVPAAKRKLGDTGVDAGVHEVSGETAMRDVPEATTAGSPATPTAAKEPGAPKRRKLSRHAAVAAALPERDPSDQSTAVVTAAALSVPQTVGSNIGLTDASVEGAQTTVVGDRTASNTGGDGSSADQPGSIRVVNDDRLLSYPDGVEGKHLGYAYYRGAKMRNKASADSSNLDLFLLPSFNTSHLYGTFEVKIAAEYLTFKSNLAVRYNAVWGTDVYSDDSDVVAEPDNTKRMLPTPPRTPLRPAPDPSAPRNAPRPLHDAVVTLRILPRLRRYAGTALNGVASRSWGVSHEGESFRVECVAEVQRPVAASCRRKSVSARWAAVAHTVLGTGDGGFGRNGAGLTQGRVAADLAAAAGFGKELNGVSGLLAGASIQELSWSGVPSDIWGSTDNATLLFSSATGVACFKYSVRAVVEWPKPLHDYLLNILSAAPSVASDNALATSDSAPPAPPPLPTPPQAVTMGIASGELKKMARWAFWRVRLHRGFVLELEDSLGRSFSLARAGIDLSTDGDSSGGDGDGDGDSVVAASAPAGDDDTLVLCVAPPHCLRSMLLPTSSKPAADSGRRRSLRLRLSDVEWVDAGLRVAVAMGAPALIMTANAPEAQTQPPLPFAFAAPLSLPPAAAAAGADVKRVFFIRHGETAANAAGRLQGRGIDQPLSLRGRRQAEALRDAMRDTGVDLTVVSSLQRTRETASFLLQQRPGVEILEFKDIDEISWGVWEGLEHVPGLTGVLDSWNGFDFDGA